MVCLNRGVLYHCIHNRGLEFKSVWLYNLILNTWRETWQWGGEYSPELEEIIDIIKEEVKNKFKNKKEIYSADIIPITENKFKLGWKDDDGKLDEICEAADNS